MAIREHGRTSFLDLVDEGRRLQCQVRVDIVGGDAYDFFRRFVERGDFVGVRGVMFNTRMGELTLQVEGFTLLSKALYDIPGEWYGLRDVEARYRQRHLDLIMNGDVRERFVARARLVSGMRRFLDGRGFLEVETPLIQESYGGASARPFTTYVNGLGETRYLQISPELYLKRLVIGGFNRVYTIYKNFRNEEIDSIHNPEFTMIEAYQAYADYNDMMELAESLITSLASELRGSSTVEYAGEEIDLGRPWRRITMHEALRQIAGMDVQAMGDDEIMEALRAADPDSHDRLLRGSGYSRGLFTARLFDSLCQRRLFQPAFVTDYPRETSPLCKSHRGDPTLIERFELFIAGMELANAYTELNDPALQETLLEEAERRGPDAHPRDEGYTEALRHGMPPTGGIGIGVDRLVMLLTGSTSIKEVLLFPMMRKVPSASKAETA
jgi:lysyl-tRNA synthetase class 2